MLTDFDLIVHRFGTDLPYLNIWALGDLHGGSAQFDHVHWNNWKRMVLEDPFSKIVCTGDTIDNGLKTSKTNCYEATMQPKEQKEWLYEELLPLKDRIIGVCDGNHEYRSKVSSGDSPLLDVMRWLGIQDLYRENMCFVNVKLGRKNAERQWSYTIVLAHGSTANKAKNFSYAIDGMDVFITGHTHEPGDNFPAKHVIDVRNEVVKKVGFVHIVVPSFQKDGGYVLRGMYKPQDHTRIPILTLKGNEKGVDVRWVQG